MEEIPNCSPSTVISTHRKEGTKSITKKATFTLILMLARFVRELQLDNDEANADYDHRLVIFGRRGTISCTIFTSMA